jgi:hypothetical protein
MRSPHSQTATDAAAPTAIVPPVISPAARQPPADLSRQLDRLEREIERLDSLISQVLKLARLHGTDTLFARETFDLDEVIEEVVRDANFEGAAKGCSVRVEGTARVLVNGNRELLRSAVENVLRNAVRYSPEDAPVEAAVVRAEGGVLITIRERGPGVPESDLERIFEPFYRVAEARDHLLQLGPHLVERTRRARHELVLAEALPPILRAGAEHHTANALDDELQPAVEALGAALHLDELAGVELVAESVDVVQDTPDDLARGVL